MGPIRIVSAVLATAIVAAGCTGHVPTGKETGAVSLGVEIVGTRPHDATAFTQGLEVFGSDLLESTGKTGESQVRATDLTSGTERIRVYLPARLFGEGITVAGATMWQLTYRDNLAIERDPRTLSERRRVTYGGEGWGLCAFDKRLVMSDGSGTLTYRDPVSFARTDSVQITGYDDARLNELECAEDGTVYANAWPTDTILRIDPYTGRVTARIDASKLLDRPDITDEQRGVAEVLNGIAQLPGTDRFLVTGKYWPTIFEVRFVS